MTFLALAPLPKFTFPLGWYDSHTCWVLQRPFPPYSTGTRVPSQLQSCHVSTGWKDNACHHLEGITAAVFQQSQGGGGRGNAGLAQLYDIFGCASLSLLGVLFTSQTNCFLTYAGFLCLFFVCLSGF